MKVRYYLSLGLLVFLFSHKANAQVSIQTLAPNPVMASEGSFLNPAYLKNTRGFELNIAPFMGIDIGLSNNFISLGNLLDYTKTADDENETDFAPLHEMLDNLNNNNSIELHSNFTLLNAVFRIGDQEKSPLHVGISVRHHIHTDFTINDKFFKLLLKGNKQYAGETVNLLPEMSAISYTDIGVAASKTLKLGDLKITPGIRIRYLLGTGAGYTNNTHLNFFTAADGSYIELSGKVDAYAGGVINGDSLVNGGGDMDLDFKKLTNALGNGIAIDIGGTVEYKNISVSLASIDNGSIHFNDQHGWHIVSHEESVRWDGLDIGEGENGNNFSENFKPFDSLDIKTENKGFSTNIGSKLTLNANYGLIKKTDKKGYDYYMNNVGINYIQGFKNIYDASTSPRISVYYQLNLGNRLTLGADWFHYRNINDMGLNFGFRAAGMKLGLGTNSLFAAFNQYGSKQAAFFFQWGFAF